MWDSWVKVSLAVALGCALCGCLVLLYRPGSERMQRLDDQIETLRTSNAQLEAEKEALANRKSLLEHDRLTVEMEARDRFGLFKEGETVYVVQDWPGE